MLNILRDRFLGKKENDAPAILPDNLIQSGPPVVKTPLVADVESWPNILKDEFVKFFCGEKLSEGTSRWVYELRYQPDLVVKVEFTDGTFQNHSEWVAWALLQNTDYADYLASCRRISPCGTLLIQERTAPLSEKELPKKYPSFIEDVKKENFGRNSKGLIVCHDYALNSLQITGINGVALQEWDEKQ